VEALAGIYVFVVIFLIVLAVCWIILPFALIGTKPILRRLLEEAQRTNELLERMAPPKTAEHPTLGASTTAESSLRPWVKNLAAQVKAFGAAPPR
jgi:predicted PurR-regulated permease PerM